MGPLAVTHAVLSLLGLITSGAAYYLPCTTTIADIRRDMSVGNRSPLSYLASFLSCALWGVYGIYPKDSYLIIVINLFGMGTQGYCLFQFLYYCENEDRMWWSLYVVPAAISLVGIVVYYWSAPDDNIGFFAWMCAFCRALAAVAPFYKLATVLSQNNMSTMPSMLMSKIALANALIWIGYACTSPGEDGLGPHVDKFILLPSIVGLASASALIWLHVVHKQDDNLRESLLRQH